MSPTPPPNPASSQKPGSIEFYQDLLNKCAIKMTPEVIAAKEFIVTYAYRFKVVELRTGVPWWVTAALEWRECDGSFKQCLHNGDPLPGPTVNVPAGRGPFSSWEDAAADALAYDGLTKVTPWSLPVACQWVEKFNGLGYLLKHSNQTLSPYLWSGTNLYTKGKYASDGNFDPNLVDKQAGVVAIWLALGIK